MLNPLIIAIVCFLASTLGPLCGIGGGVIIKPIYPRAPNPREPHAQARGTSAQGLLSTPLLPRYQNDTFKQQKYGYKHLTRA